MLCFDIVMFFPLQPIQDKEIIAEDEQTFLAKQQVGFFFGIGNLRLFTLFW